VRLLLSSDALPDAPFEALVEAARRRHLAGLELSLDRGQGHGADATACAARQGDGVACFPAVPTDLTVAWLLLPEEAPLALRTVWASAASRLGAGVLLRRPAPEPLAAPTALVHGTDPASARRAAQWAEAHGAGTALEVRPAAFEADRWAAVLDATGPRLAHVRLVGAGPEAQAAEAGDVSDGTGWLLGRLALRGYGGTVALAPSSPEALPAWEHWLRRGRGWGCGTAAEKQAAATRKALATS
jgi:hypothetical protein